ncbi:MAG: protein tyrosine phosphatase [Gammaproteobacteria bacterium]|nr:protein tyrosine phosphatase [Gammaproteobacteria bacterium]
MNDPLTGVWSWPAVDSGEAELRRAAHPALLPPARTPRGRRTPLRTWMAALLLDHALLRTFFNTRVRISPGVYRSSHPLPYQLRSAQRAGIRSVLNLRGVEAHVAANRLEWDYCRRAGLRVVHFPLGSRQAPYRDEVLALIALFERLERPLLLHCKSGADRAGFASTVFLLTQTGTPLEAALRQLSFWRHGHIRQARTGVFDRFFDTYRAHRDAHGSTFAGWVRDVYDREQLIAMFRANYWADHVVDRILHRE